MTHLGKPGPASIIADATHDAVEALSSISDPVQRASAAEDSIANAEGCIKRLAAERHRALIEAAKSKTVTEIADEIGVDASRVTQLMNKTDQTGL